MNDYGCVVRSEAEMQKALARMTDIDDSLLASYCPGRAYIESLQPRCALVEILAGGARAETERRRALQGGLK